MNAEKRNFVLARLLQRNHVNRVLKSHRPDRNIPECMPIRVLLVDDNVLVREALSVLLQVRAGLTVVGEAGSRKKRW